MLAAITLGCFLAGGAVFVVAFTLFAAMVWSVLWVLDNKGPIRAALLAALYLMILGGLTIGPDLCK